MPTIITAGAASARGYGFGASAATAANYIEDVFSTYLYTGNGTARSINNGIDLSTKGGMVWFKSRSNVTNHQIFDTARGVTNFIRPNLSNAQATSSTSLTAFNTNGFSLSTPGNSDGETNASGYTYTSWTFRKQAKFFDVVTWTGNAATPRTITHNLGSIPGCIIVKKYSGTAEDWYVFHRSLGNAGGFAYFCILNTTAAQDTGGNGIESSTAWTATSFRLISAGGSTLNENGETYVAYLFAHNAGGFGAAGTDNVISCGSYAGNGSTTGPTITLGYEPQWLMIKRSDSAQSWTIYDNMRGIVTGGDDPFLMANYTDSETTTGVDWISATATGFSLNTVDQQVNSGTGNYIYIAIRRGPMKTPTSGTSVYTSSATTNTTGSTITTNFSVDLAFDRPKAVGYNWQWQDRLRGSVLLQSNSTGAEFTPSPLLFSFDNNTAVKLNGFLDGDGNAHAWLFRRAPGFFDVVCYTGTGANTTQNHNLNAIPELIIVKQRNLPRLWGVYSAALAANEVLVLNDVNAKDVQATYFNSTRPTSSVFSVGTNPVTNGSANTYVAYLFATVAGVSKVGSYTGTAALQTINCGFTSGARFVLIKRTDSTGDWYVWDSARGIVAANDPYLLLNSTAAEVTNTDYIDPYSAGFEISSTAPAAINANGGSFIYLAIA